MEKNPILKSQLLSAKKNVLHEKTESDCFKYDQYLTLMADTKKLSHFYIHLNILFFDIHCKSCSLIFHLSQSICQPSCYFNFTRKLAYRNQEIPFSLGTSSDPTTKKILKFPGSFDNVKICYWHRKKILIFS